MKSLAFHLLAASFALTACGGDDSTDTTSDDIAIDAPTNVDASPSPDAASNVDAPPATTRVMEVTCPTTPDKSIQTMNFAFSPNAVTIPVGGVVKFTLEAQHNLGPLAPTTDAALSAGFGATKCFKFSAADAYHYKCVMHPSMTGTITVQ